MFGKKDKEAAEKPAASKRAPAAPARNAASARNGAQAPALDPAQAQKGAAESQHLLLGLGQVVTVLMHSPQFKEMTLKAMQALVVPAVSSGQFVVAMAQSGKSGHLSPVAVALWANVSDEVDKRWSRDLDKPFSIASNEWRSGTNPWLITLVGDRRVINPLLAKVQQTTLKGKKLKMRVPDEGGKASVREFSASAAQPQTPAA